MTRRLSAEMRKTRQAELDEERETGGLITLEVELDDALHDLDVADGELAEAQTTIGQQAEEIKHFHQMQLPDQSAMKAHIQECIEDAVASRDAWIATLRKAAEGLWDKLESLPDDSRYMAVWSLWATHFGSYTGPQYVEEKNALKNALDNTARLAADHDAKVREPLEAQIANLSDGMIELMHRVNERSPTEINEAPDRIGSKFYYLTDLQKAYHRCQRILDKSDWNLANHDAEVRRPLEAQIAAMQSLLLNVFLAEWDSTKTKEYGQRIAFRQGITQIHKLIDNAESFTSGELARIQAEARADERVKVLEEVRRQWLVLSSDEWAKWLEGQVVDRHP